MSDQPLSPPSPPSYAPVQAPAVEIPNYLRFHWALVLVVMIVVNLVIRGSWAAWLLVQAHWMRKVTGQSGAYMKALVALVLLVATFVLGLFTGGVASLATYNNNNGIGSAAAGIGTLILLSVTALVSLAAVIVYIMAAFSLRAELEAAPFGMKLSAPMTFFFHSIYFQYHLNKWGMPGEVGGQPVVYAAPPPPPVPPSIPPAQS